MVNTLSVLLGSGVRSSGRIQARATICYGGSRSLEVKRASIWRGA